MSKQDLDFHLLFHIVFIHTFPSHDSRCFPKTGKKEYWASSFLFLFSKIHTFFTDSWEVFPNWVRGQDLLARADFQD